MYEEDFKLWKSLDNKNLKIDFKSFPDLNHLMYFPEKMKRTTKLSGPMEYQIPCKFNQDVLFSIVEFMGK